MTDCLRMSRCPVNQQGNLFVPDCLQTWKNPNPSNPVDMSMSIPTKQPSNEAVTVEQIWTAEAEDVIPSNTSSGLHVGLTLTPRLRTASVLP